MKKLVRFSIILSLLSCNFLLAQIENSPQFGDPIRAYLNLNNISTLFMNDGISDVNIDQNSARFIFPRSTGKTAVYQSGLLWGAILYRPGEQDIHVGGSVYRSGLLGGKIVSLGVPEDPTLPHVRIYRVRPDVYPGGPAVDLSVEALDEGKTEQEIRDQYELDWTEWRAQDGAPFDDVDENGIYNPTVDIPGVMGASQTIWFVANDLYPSRTSYMYGTDPMGIEYQATYWAYNNGSFLDNLFFRKYRLINKSDVSFNDMYISMWSDTDIGYPGDDLAGCDTTLNMVYSYNGYDYDPDYDSYPPPAIGFDLLKGPTIQGNQNLPMTAAYYFSGASPSLADPVQGSYPEGAVRFYRTLRGLIGLTGQPKVNPETGLPTTYSLSGDPLTGEGWIDGEQYGPGDRRIGLASGPFDMAVGDTQEVVIAEIAAIGIDRLQAFKILKYYDGLTQAAFDNGLETLASIPPKTETPNTSVTGTTWTIKLNWGLDTSSVSSIENFSEDGYEFQGYNVYQLASPLPIKENAIRIATFDKIDGITEIEGIVMDPETGLPVNGIQQYGSDSGIKRFFKTNHDYVEGEYMKVGKKYYFAVTAYTYNADPQANPNNSESLMEVIEAVFYDSLGGAGYGDSILVTHPQGNGNGKVYVTVDDATQLTGDDYEVFFNKQQYYRNEFGEWVPGFPGRPSGPDTLTGSSIDMTAVYGPASGSLEIFCLLDLVSPDFNWADGISLTFPAGTTILDAPEFQATNSWIIPEIVGNTVNFGIVNGPPTGYGAFVGGEEWSVVISPNQVPLTVDWIIYDDGYSGGTLNAEGSTVINAVGYATKIEDHWNVFNLTTQDTVLEDQTVIMGYNLYTGEYVGDPVVEGFKISVYANYNDPTTMGRVLENEVELTFNSPNNWWLNDNFTVCDFTRFGYENGYAATSLPLYGGAGGTTNLDLLTQDLEFRWTGVPSDTIANGISITITSSGGSIATIFGASGYDLAYHPLNPNYGTEAPFTIRVPFEVWNVDLNQQVNLIYWDRSNNPTVNGSYSWIPDNRTYTWVVNTPYSTDLIDVTSQVVEDNATWNVVYYLSTYTLNDEINLKYLAAITSLDKFTFTTPEGVVSVEDENIPTKFELFQNYPNPFNPSTRIRFTLPSQSLVKLNVYNILGERVAQIVNTELNAGTHEVMFDASRLASGVYFYSLDVQDKFFEVKKMILIK